MPKSTGADSQLVLSDIHHRITGVSASIRSVLPALAKHYPLLFLARQGEGDVRAISLRQGLKILRQPVSGRPFRIWHVRRNNEMLWGLILRDWLRCPVKLVFTSAAIRRHSWYPRQLIQRMDAVIATSTKASQLVPHVKAVVPHGVDVDVFSRGERDRLKSPWQKYSVRIGLVGRLRPEKGTDLFVDALCRVLSSHPNACGILAGRATSRYQAFLKEQQRKLEKAGVLDRVFFADEIDRADMPDFYSDLDIVCAPARYEGFGLVPLEAMVSGTAVLASRTGAYEDIVDDGVTGRLVPVGDGEQLTRALNELLQQPDQVTEMKARGCERVRAHFSLDAEIAGMRAVYESLWKEHS